jgi:phage-related protein
LGFFLMANCQHVRQRLSSVKRISKGGFPSHQIRRAVAHETNYGKVRLDRIYKNLYTLAMKEAQDPPSRIKWEGDSREEIHTWPKPPKANIAGDLTRLEKGEDPLDFDHLNDGIYELRDRHMGVWYRLLYWLNAGWIYVLHCFKKKTNQTPQSDLRLAKLRRRRVLDRKDRPYVKRETEQDEEEESA